MNNHQKILMYHSIGGSSLTEVGAGLYSVSLEKFREQMEYLHKHEDVRCSMLDARKELSASSRELSAKRLDTQYSIRNTQYSKTVLVTFDDGLEDNYTNAYSMLKEFGLKAYFFILVAKMGKSGYMSWYQVRELKEAGMIIGSHGMTHRILTGMNDKELYYELNTSKAILEEKLGAPVEYLSLPRGFGNKKVIARAKDAGYRGVFTSSIKHDDGFRFGRIAVKANWSSEYFARVINSGLSFRDKAGEAIKDSSKKLLGAKNYDRVRAKLLARKLMSS